MSNDVENFEENVSDERVKKGWGIDWGMILDNVLTVVLAVFVIYAVEIFFLSSEDEKVKEENDKLAETTQGEIRKEREELGGPFFEKTGAGSYQYLINICNRSDGVARSSVESFGLREKVKKAEVKKWLVDVCFKKIQEESSMRLTSVLSKDYWEVNDWKEVLSWIEQEVIREDDGGEAEYYAGLIIRNTGDDKRAAMKYWEKSAAKGNKKALMILGDCHEEGFGGEKDFLKAFELYQKAAKSGCFYSNEKLAMYHEAGIGVEQNEEKAVKSFICGIEKIDYMIASQKSSYIMRTLARSYRMEEKKALAWYVKGATLGIVEAQRELAFCYELGLGIGMNRREALRWYHKAAKAGCTFSMLRIGYFYEQGWEKELSWDTALEWYKKAKESGHPEAIEYINDVFNKRAEERTKKEKMSSDFGKTMYS